MQTEEKSNVLQDVATVIIIEGLPPEEGAMSQALYSRKPDSILSLLNQVFRKGAKSFMSIFYSGYGHNSIGDCGSTTLHFEDVSMLAAKALQASPLYNGQEASTRYLDFKGRKMINPLGGQPETKHLYIPPNKLNEKALQTIANEFDTVHTASTETEAGIQGAFIQRKWMEFYENNMDKVKEYVSGLNPIKEGEDQAQYEKAVKARAFDIMRGFIPAGMTTMLSWHSNIRHLRDRLGVLKYHPSDEIGRISQTALFGLQSAYPSSFMNKEYLPTEAYLMLKAQKTSYFLPTPLSNGKKFEIDDTGLDMEMLKNNFHELLTERPAKNELPNEVGEAGVVNVRFEIDFGSFRDAQRHRKGVCKMPLLTTSLGFNEWYLERLPKEVRLEAVDLIDELVPLIDALPCDDVARQYYISMGFNVIAQFTWSFDQCVYVAELRSSETVHPTFRVHAQKLGQWISKVAPYAALYVDYDGDKWSYKRGAQDIIAK